MKLSWEAVRTILRNTAIVSVALSIGSLFFWLYVGQVDEICAYREGDEGLLRFESFGEEKVRCDPIWSGVALYVVYFSILFSPLGLTLAVVGRLIAGSGFLPWIKR